VRNVLDAPTAALVGAATFLGGQPGALSDGKAGRFAADGGVGALNIAVTDGHTGEGAA
jgi:hypothetical protein